MGNPRKEAPSGDFRVLGVRWRGGVARSSVTNFRLGTLGVRSLERPMIRIAFRIIGFKTTIAGLIIAALRWEVGPDDPRSSRRPPSASSGFGCSRCCIDHRLRRIHGTGVTTTDPKGRLITGGFRSAGERSRAEAT